MGLLVISGARAQDTFSIVAVDTVTGEVGSAGASCINSSIIISDVHPGIGAVHTQSFWNDQNQSLAGILMDENFSPQQIIDSVTRKDAEGNPHVRQYGVVTFAGPVRAAAYTGDSCLDYKGHIVGPYYSIQGNILKGRVVLEQMEANFLATSGPLHDRLMAALQGAKMPGADSRCLADGTSSKSSFLRVANQDDLYIDLQVLAVRTGTEPIDSLQKVYDAWKQTNAVGDRNSVRPLFTVNVHTGDGRITFELPSISKSSYIEISDPTGRVIHRLKMEQKNQASIERSSLGAGVYFYRVIDSSLSVLASGKFVVE
jgi:uncharacterized Ntn-hydrolase superfamily protein